ncbi:MAG: hypothetical protein R2705_20325 [Ilumatobacteraceae bacterium]
MVRVSGTALPSCPEWGISDVAANFAPGIEPDPDARIITASCGGVRPSVYVPNGRSLDNDHYRYKLDWMGRLRFHVEATSAPSDDVVVAGDFNIADGPRRLRPASSGSERPT